MTYIIRFPVHAISLDHVQVEHSVDALRWGLVGINVYISIVT